jgi:hypothetical protein
MLWKEIKSWSKEKGYKTDRTKVEGSTNSYHYVWSKMDTPSVSGEASSVTKLAFAIYNHMTDNTHVEYQQSYQQNIEDIIHDQGFGFR